MAIRCRWVWFQKLFGHYIFRNIMGLEVHDQTSTSHLNTWTQTKSQNGPISIYTSKKRTSGILVQVFQVNFLTCFSVFLLVPVLWFHHQKLPFSVVICEASRTCFSPRTRRPKSLLLAATARPNLHPRRFTSNCKTCDGFSCFCPESSESKIGNHNGSKNGSISFATCAVL